MICCLPVIGALEYIQIIEILKMKEIVCRNINKYVSNHNRGVGRQLQSQTVSSRLSIESILGLTSQSIKGQVVFPLNSEEIIYYCSQYFIVHNLISKSHLVIEKQGCAQFKTLYMDRFENGLKRQLILTIEQHSSGLHIGQLQITGHFRELSNKSSFSEEKQQNYSWQISKLTSNPHINVIKMAYYSSKRFLYLIVSKSKQNLEKYIWVYDLKRQCKILSLEIHPNLSKTQINSLWLTDEPTEVYLMGKNYFRLWTLSFNQKTLKESNYRNIERNIANKNIVKIFNYNLQDSRHIGILTCTHFILIKKNQLISCEKPLESSLKKGKHQDNIELQLQTSLNQIGKLKFMLDSEQLQRRTIDKEEQLKTEEGGNWFESASPMWSSEGLDFIIMATKKGHILTYNIVNGQLKLTNESIPKNRHYFDMIATSKGGEIAIFSSNQSCEIYIINKYQLNQDDNEGQLTRFWGAGHVNHQNIISIDSPCLHQRVCTLGEDSTLQLWSFNGKERKIMFEERLQNCPRYVAMHPCGLLLTINYPKQIKLMSVLPSGLYQILSVKTNYSSVGLMYSECGNYLVSNEKNLLMFYNPFTLKVLGYMQSPEIKSTIVNFSITPEGNYLVYFTSDFSLYIQFLNLSHHNKYEYVKPAHVQQEPYTCFHFTNINCSTNTTKSNSCHNDKTTANKGKATANENKTESNEGSSKIYNKAATNLIAGSKSCNNPAIASNSSAHGANPNNTQQNNLFIGCTQHKYMVLYSHFGKTLIAEFPVLDCYITCMCVAQQWLFAATSKGSIRVYRWPILQSQCELEVINQERRQVRLCAPAFQEFFFWQDGQKITKMHKINFRSQLIVIRQEGLMHVLNYDRMASQKLEEVVERSKLSQIINETFFITRTDSQKRNRMIEKTQNDILKVQSQISKEKMIMQRQYLQECSQIEKTYIEKTAFNQRQKGEYLLRLKEEILRLREELRGKMSLNGKEQQRKEEQYKKKQHYEQGYNSKIDSEIKNTVKAHKSSIAETIKAQKENIREVKKQYREKIINLKRQFQSIIAQEHPHLTIPHIPQNNNNNTNTTTKNSTLTHHHSFDPFDTIHSQEINLLSLKVEEVKGSNKELRRQLGETKEKAKMVDSQDEQLQKQLQQCLENYNSRRFHNLGLHSEVLKMRTQLIERSQIMENKQQIINEAFQQRQKLQNYKELVKGSLSRQEQKKQQSHTALESKEEQLQLIYEELVHNINHAENIKRQEKRVEELSRIIANQKSKRQKQSEQYVLRLKEIKRYLLLQGLNEDAEQKKMYVEQQNLLTTINFYKKRMSMEFLKEKKNKTLKKSALHLVLRQNKNLLEECNQLRTQNLQYDHQIKNLGLRIGEANKMITIEQKIKEQSMEVNEQKQQLQAIRVLFSHHLASNQYEPL